VHLVERLLVVAAIALVRQVLAARLGVRRIRRGGRYPLGRVALDRDRAVGPAPDLDQVGARPAVLGA